MDLEVKIDGIFLNIRVAVLLKTNKGFVLEKHRNGYFYFIGGRIKINETSEEAVRREVLEEIGIEVKKITFKTILENFFVLKEGDPVHEFCFVYMVDDEIEINNLPPNFIECPLDDFNTMDIKPKVIKDFISTNDTHSHIVSKNL